MKKKITPVASNETASSSPFDEKDDFKFVQLGKNIHDVKFKDKPTTFLKDALIRFTKNRSSVVAAVLLGIIIGFAIFVPIVNTNSLDSPSPYASYLPPKWFEVNSNGFLDGTKRYSNIVCENKNGGSVTASTPNSDLRPVKYVSEAIVGDLDVSVSQYSATSQYGYGGFVFLKPTTHDSNALFTSSKGIWRGSDDYDLHLNLDKALIDSTNNGECTSAYRVLANGYFDDTSTIPSSILIKDWSLDYGDVSVPSINALIAAGYTGSTPLPSASAMSFSIELKTTAKSGGALSAVYPSLYVKNFYLQAQNEESGAGTSITKIGFTDANEALLRNTSKDTAVKALAWNITGGANIGASNVNIKVASFRYDAYLAAYGESSQVVSKDQIESWISKGYMSYDFETGVSSFKILNDNCPLRSATSQKSTTITIDNGDGTKTKVTTYSVTGSVSTYRFYGYSSMPRFVFGTDGSGYDYFKLLFTGLRTSLILGVLCALINITVGLIWGAVSGYFGGWVDMLMERFTEILGGIPWIVVMTLCILILGQTFSVFLLALCLTGWMGVASTTRSQFYRYKGREYVLASRTLGAKDWRLIFKHILPNSIGPIVTGSVLMIPGVIFDEATISFLGLGLKGWKSFGVALSNAQSQMSIAPYMIITSSLIVCILMISFNLFGNGLRDAFNPSLKGVDE